MMLFLAKEELSNLCSLLGIYSQYLGGSRSLHAHKLNRFSHVQLFVTLWTIAYQALLSMGFSRQGYWRGLPCPPPGDLPNPGIESRSPAFQADS